MTIKEAIEKGADFLKKKGCESARLETELILAHVLGVERIQLYVNFDRPLSETEKVRSRKILVNRAEGQPVAHLIGRWGFYKSEFIVEPGVLVPRSDTETLVSAVLDELEDTPTCIFDWGCGTGCIGLSLLLERPNANLVAIDVSEKSVALTLRNAGELGLSERVKVIESEIESTDFSPYRDTKKMIVANPPYIAPGDPEVCSAVAAHEPERALFSGENGLEHLKRWGRLASGMLKPGEIYATEIGYRQATSIGDFYKELFASVTVHKDLEKRDRVLLCRR